MQTPTRAALACASAAILATLAFAAYRNRETTDSVPTAAPRAATSTRPPSDPPIKRNLKVMEILSSPTGPLSVEPTVPRPDTKPCVVELFTDSNLMGIVGFDYAPPPANCPRPWSKIVLEMDMTPVTRTGSIGNVAIRLMHFPFEIIGGVAYTRSWDLFLGAPQVSASTPTWHVERDLTHYAALLAEPEELVGDVHAEGDNIGVSVDEDEVHGSARLLFYPPSVANPAPRVPDAVLPSDFPNLMPRNIVRAYVEVIAQGLDVGDALRDDRMWYTCMPDATLARYPGLRNPFTIGDNWGGSLSSTFNGCGGGSYRQVEVDIDGVLVGTAPLMPWLPNNFHRRFPDTLDPPLPGVQALNFMPYHVDITPFAGALNSGTRHLLTLRMVGDTGGVFSSVAIVSGKMFIFTDPKRTIVPGAVTSYNLAPALAPPSVSSEFTRTGDALRGTVRTRKDGVWSVEGYVDTSAGRVVTRVQGRTRFDNYQVVLVDGDTFPVFRGYGLNLALDSRVDQVSIRASGGSILALDARSLHQPLQLFYAFSGHMDPTGEGGYFTAPHQALAAADQVRDIYAEHWRGPTHYISALRDHFYGQRFHDYLTDTDTAWRSQREYAFLDSLASCFSAARTSTMGVLTGSSAGVGCPGGINDVIWHSRPDGSPEMMGWAE